MGLKNDLEVEIKIQVKNLAALLKWLEKNAVLDKETHQIDRYFDHPDRSFVYIDKDGYRTASEWLRVRFEEDRAEICYKHWHRDNKTGKSTYADEFESEISDGEAFLKILKVLGFKQISLIDKRRTVWQYQDFEFAIDQVKGLGDFAEIEYEGEMEDPSRANQKIFDLLREIGLKGWQKTRRGYNTMLWNPGKDRFEVVESPQ